jgi:hypothetical protein
MWEAAGRRQASAGSRSVASRSEEATGEAVSGVAGLGAALMTATIFVLYSPHGKKKTLPPGADQPSGEQLRPNRYAASYGYIDRLGKCSGTGCMMLLPKVSPDLALVMMHSLIHWLGINRNIFAVLITVGVAVFLVCCLECSKCGCREKDDLFKRHQV